MAIKIKAKSPDETLVVAGPPSQLQKAIQETLDAINAVGASPILDGDTGKSVLQGGTGYGKKIGSYNASPSLTVSPQPYSGDTAYLPHGQEDKEETYTAVKPAALKTHQGTASVMVKHPDGSETTGQEAVGKPKVFAGPPCTVGVSAQFTKNMGNYQSCRLGVEITVPCAHTEIDQVYAFAKDWVDNRLAQALESVETALKS